MRLRRGILCSALSLALGLSGCHFQELTGGFGARFPREAIDEREAATALIQELDLSPPQLRALRIAAERRQYRLFLELYRQRLVMKLRALDLGELMWHKAQLVPAYVSEAELLIGRWTPQQYHREIGRNWGCVTNGQVKEIKQWEKLAAAGFMAPPGSRIDWFIPGAAATENDLPGLYCAHSTGGYPASLVAAWWLSNEPGYKDKWFDITSQYCREFWKADVRARLGRDWAKTVAAERPDARSLNQSWAVHPLSASWRVPMILKSLGLFAKNLERPEQPPRWKQGLGEALTQLPASITLEWETALKPVKGPLTPPQFQAIPADKLAWIAISLVNEFTPMMIENYIRGDYFFPNQNFSGLHAIAMTGLILEDFQATPQINQIVNDALSRWANRTFNPDGGMLEQSFNYNQSTLTEMRHLLTYFNSSGCRAPWIRDYQERIGRFELLLKTLETPQGTLPMMGNSDYTAITPQGIAVASPAETRHPALPQESIYYPYSGYAAMRSRGPATDQLYLMFANSRRSIGHLSPNTGSIHVNAYGRDLIVPGGAPSYGLTCAEQKSEEKEFDGYFGEHSSFKNSTVLVNGLSQAIWDRGRDRNWLLSAPVTRVAARWSSSPAFDLIESRWCGYEKRKDNHLWSGKPLELIDDIEHQRLLIFVKAAKLWLVSDLLRFAPERIPPAKKDAPPLNHTFTQVWNFAPPGDAKKPLYGFTHDQVVVDAAAASVQTTDPAGVNLRLLHFCGKPLRYEAFFGHKDAHQYLGWFSSGIGTIKTPRVDLHVSWQSDAAELAESRLFPLVSVLAPSRKNQEWLSSATPRLEHDGQVAGCELLTASGVSLTFLTAAKASSLQVDKLSADAQLVLVVRDPAHGEIQSGVVLGCRGLRLNQKWLPLETPDFEFEIESNSVIVKNPISQ